MMNAKKLIEQCSKLRAHVGYQFEAADASLFILNEFNNYWSRANFF